MKFALRKRATTLRKNGWSYNVIARRLKVSKGTLSAWLREVPYQPNKKVLQRMRAGPAKSHLMRHQQKLRDILEAKKRARKEIGKLRERDLWMLGLGIYIGEGTKLYESIRIINSDPHVIKVSMKWFRYICGLRSKNFNIAVHIYPDISEQAALRYWSKITEIPISQFGKTQIDRRTGKSIRKQRKLPFGTAHITVKACGEPQFGVLLHRRIIGWIEAVYSQGGTRV